MKILVILSLSCLSFAQTYEVSIIGVSSRESSSEVYTRYKPFTDYLSRKVYSGMVKGSVKLRVFKNEKELRTALQEGTIHIARLSPQSFIMVQSKLTNIHLFAGELKDHQFFEEGSLIVQKSNFVRNFTHFKNHSFAFGPKTSPLLDIVPKSVLSEKGLTNSDLKPLYLSDVEKVMRYVEVGRVIAGVIPSKSLPEDDRFRVFAEFSAPGMVWAMSDRIFLSTRDKIKSEFLEVDEPPIMRSMLITGFRKISNHDLLEYKQALNKAMIYYKKK